MNDIITEFFELKAKVDECVEALPENEEADKALLAMARFQAFVQHKLISEIDRLDKLNSDLSALVRGKVDLPTFALRFIMDKGLLPEFEELLSRSIRKAN